jgi:tyrosine-specific transport protein
LKKSFSTRKMVMNKNFVFALVVLIGTIIGAGVFGLPYVISKSGLLPAFVYFFVLGGAVLLMHLFFGEIILRTEGKYRVVGYANKYLGKPGKLLMSVSMIVGLTGSLLAYGILAGDFMKTIFSYAWPAAGWVTPSLLTVCFFLALAVFIFRGMKLIAPIELLTNTFFFLIIAAIFIFGADKIDYQNFSLMSSTNIRNLFLPYGVIMFSLIGWTAIPEIMDLLKTSTEKKNFKKIIIISTVFCTLFYLVFSLVAWGISGQNTSLETLFGLQPFLGNKVIFFGALAATITLIDSFLILGLSLKNTLTYDLKVPGFLAALVTSGLPLILFLAGFKSFIGTIGFMGTILGAVDGVIIILIYRAAKKSGDRRPEYQLKTSGFIIYFLVLLFVLGALAQVLSYI